MKYVFFTFIENFNHIEEHIRDVHKCHGTKSMQYKEVK